MQPDVTQREPDLFEQMENEFEFGVGKRFAGDTPIKHGHAQQGIAVKDGHGDLAAEQFKFLLCLHVGADLVAVAAQNSTQAEKLTAQSRIERQFKMFQQTGCQTQGAGQA